jgi:hypothetical protein
MRNVFSSSVEAIWFLNPINRDRRTRIGSAVPGCLVVYLSTVFGSLLREVQGF